jgi:peptide/nickel transport system substrate-binding protein
MNRKISKISWIILAVLLCLSLVLVPGCTTPAEPEEPTVAIPYKNADTFIQMTIGDIDSLDPAWGYDTASAEQTGYIYEPLLYFDGTKTDEFRPVLATEWNASEDGLTIRFKIRDGVKFQNGDDLTPEDVEYSIERAMVQDRDAGPVWMLYGPLLGLPGSRDADGNIAVTFDQIDNAVEVDGDWVQFNLVSAFPTLTFYQILCGNWALIVDKEWCVAQGDWDGTEETWEDYNNPDPGTTALHDKTNGTGPWKLELWDPGIQVKLVRNDSYWGDPAPFERVITQVVDEWTNRKLALLAGDADFVYVPRAYIGELEGINDLTVYKDLPQLNIDCFYFVMDINPDSPYIGSGQLDGNGIPTDFFSDIDVRKAFCYAFNWDTYINDALMGEAKQMASPIIEGLAYWNPDAPMYSYDLDKAEEHLKAAWGGEVWEKGFEFTLIYNVGNEARKTACEILSEGLARIDPKFKVKVLPTQWSSTLRMIATMTMPMYQIGWLADYPDPDNFVNPMMYSRGIFSQFQGYSNPEIDALIEEGAVEVDPVHRQEIYYELQQLFYDEAPSIALVQPTGRRYFTKYIEGFYFNPCIPGNAGPLYYMSKSES